MSGDYTRFTHKPRKRYSAVLMQQGRVQLDADPNELAEITKRRWEVQARDVFGDCAVPGATTPDAFEIVVAPNPPLDLLLGVGRMYVNGLLAEIFDGESFSYLKQPFFPTPPNLASVVGSSSVAFIDVWEREVTYIEDRDLLEVALSGPDTTTRIQTVWQVKVAEGNCATDFNALFPPSAGRLSSRAVQPPASDDECVIAPSGGYRGLENRLYRVEIHLPGAAGDVTNIRFKWSRENASVVSSVETIGTGGNQSQVTVTRVGRDKVLRFKINDWIEVLDDHRELMEQPGAMARIVGIDEANRRLTLDRLLPADFDAADATRHTRVIRWDQQQNVDGDGLIAGSADWIPLEDGVEVRLALEPTSGVYHVRDYWAFAARTADGSVEVITEAPPRAIFHHYCALATLTGVSDGAIKGVQDCRHICTPCAGEAQQPGVKAECCVIVEPGGSIQGAIDALPPSGGCICLKAGTHTITGALLIKSSNIVMHGESLGTRLVRGNGLPLLSIKGSKSIDVRDIHFELTGTGVGKGPEIAIVALEDCEEIMVARCAMFVASPLGAGPQVSIPAAAISIQKSTSIRIRENEMRSVLFGVWAASSDFVHVSANRIVAPPVSGPNGTLSGVIGVFAGDGGEGPWHVEGNQIENFRIGVFISAEAERSRVALNVIERAGRIPPPDPAAEPLDPKGLLVGGEKVEPLDPGRQYAIDVAAPHCDIEANATTLIEPRHGGIRATGLQARIEDNVVVSEAPVSGTTPPLAILVGPRTAGGGRPDGSVVKGNTIAGFQDGILATGTDARELQRIHVVANQIQPLATAKPRLAVGLKNTDGALAGENRIAGAAIGVLLSDGRNNRVAGNQVTDGGFGLFAGGDIGETSLELSGNVIENMSGAGIAASKLLELAVVTHNRLTWCGHASPTGSDNAALTLSSSGHVRVESCEIQDAGLSPTGSKAKGAVYGIRISARSCHVGSNRTTYSDFTLLTPSGAHRALLVEADVTSDNATIVDNAFAGSGLPHLVEIRRFPPSITGRRFRNVIFSNNRCDHRGTAAPSASGPATVALWAHHLGVSGNHIESQTAAFPSVNFNGLEQVTVVANVTTGVFVDLGGSIPAPAASFNLKL